MLLLQKVVFCFVKGHLSSCVLPSFTLQKTANGKCPCRRHIMARRDNVGRKVSILILTNNHMQWRIYAKT